MYIFPYHIQESDEAQSDSSDEENCGKSSLDKRKKALLARFSRNAFRTSLSNRPEMFLWMEAQEKLEEKFKQVGCLYGCQQGSIIRTGLVLRASLRTVSVLWSSVHSVIMLVVGSLVSLEQKHVHFSFSDMSVMYTVWFILFCTCHHILFVCIATHLC